MEVTISESNGLIVNKIFVKGYNSRAFIGLTPSEQKLEEKLDNNNKYE